LAWDGQTSIFENGTLLVEGERFRQDGQVTVADVDLDLLRQERSSMGTFNDNRSNKTNGNSCRNIQFSLAPPEESLDLSSVCARSDRKGW
jgi:NAD+ synthase (glutamine-hydrolysing)